MSGKKCFRWAIAAGLVTGLVLLVRWLATGCAPDVVSVITLGKGWAITLPFTLPGWSAALAAAAIGALASLTDDARRRSPMQRFRHVAYEFCAASLVACLLTGLVLACFSGSSGVFFALVISPLLVALLGLCLPFVVGISLLTETQLCMRISTRARRWFWPAGE